MTDKKFIKAMALVEAAIKVVAAKRRCFEGKPLVCCWVDCPHRGEEDAPCDHNKHPSGWIGLGAGLWDDIDKLDDALHRFLLLHGENHSSS